VTVIRCEHGVRFAGRYERWGAGDRAADHRRERNRQGDRTIGIVAEVLGAGIVVAETGILFAGVVSRYVFNSPLMWTDELANFLFLWLAMLEPLSRCAATNTCV
jgi:hypothetical protein